MGPPWYRLTKNRKVDNPVGDDRKSSIIINANDAFYGEMALAA